MTLTTWFANKNQMHILWNSYLLLWWKLNWLHFSTMTNYTSPNVKKLNPNYFVYGFRFDRKCVKVVCRSSNSQFDSQIIKRMDAMRIITSGNISKLLLSFAIFFLLFVMMSNWVVVDALKLCWEHIKCNFRWKLFVMYKVMTLKSKQKLPILLTSISFIAVCEACNNDVHCIHMNAVETIKSQVFSLKYNLWIRNFCSCWNGITWCMCLADRVLLVYNKNTK